MQTELITDKHRELLLQDFGKTFEELEQMPDDELDDFVIQELAMAECDEIEAFENKEYSDRGQTVSEIIDIICGPYDPDVINVPDEDENE